LCLINVVLSACRVQAVVPLTVEVVAAQDAVGFECLHLLLSALARSPSGPAAAGGCDRLPASATRNGNRSTTRSGLTDGRGLTAGLGARVCAAATGAHDGPRRATRLFSSLDTTLPPIVMTASLVRRLIA